MFMIISKFYFKFQNLRLKLLFHKRVTVFKGKIVVCQSTKING